MNLLPHESLISGDDKWIGALPSHWSTKRLKHAVELVNQKVEPSGQRYVGMENVSSWTGKYIESGECQPEGPSNSFYCGSVLFGKLRPYLAKSLLATFDGICSSEFLVLNGTALCPRFLHYFMLSDGFVWRVDSTTYGSKMPRASWDDISLFLVPIPSPDEQIAIADFLDRETAKIGTLIDKHEQLINLLDEKRQAVISRAVTKGLNASMRMKDSGVEWLGRVPEHWEVLKGGYLGSFFGTDTVSDENVGNEGRIPYLKVAALSNDGLEPRNCEWFVDPSVGDRVRPKSGYVVFPKRGAAIFLNKVNVVVYPSLIDPNLMGWQTNARVNPYFLAYVLLARKLDELADVSTVPQINNKHIAPEKFPVPPLGEQDAIVEHLRDTMLSATALVEGARTAVRLLIERRTALISAAVTGKIDVRNVA